MAFNRNDKKWDGLCNPCKKTGLYATASFFCQDCKHIYCENCSKLHKLQYAGNSHYLTQLIHEVDGEERCASVLDIAAFRYDEFGNEETDQQKVKYQYIKALISDHDHVNQTYPDELYCTFHREVTCAKCKFRRHSMCTGCIPLSRACNMLVEGGQYLKVISRIKQCHNQAENALQVATSERKLLNENEGAILKQIQDLKIAVITRVCQLEQQLVDKIDSSHGKAVRNLSKTVKNLQKIKQVSNEMLDVLRNKTKNGIEESSFKTILDCHVKSVLFINMLGSFCDIYDLENINECLFKSNHSNETINQCFGSLGTVSVYKFNSQLPLILLEGGNSQSIDVRTEVDNDMAAVFSHEVHNFDDEIIQNIMDQFSINEKRITRWSNPCIIKQGMVSIICLSADTLLALDRTTCALVLIERFGDIVTTHQFNCMPWSMALYDENTVAVSVPGENKIYLVALNDNNFFIHKEIECEQEPSAVSCCHDNVFVTSYPWSDRAAVYRLSNEGRVTATIDINPSTGSRYFKAPLEICVDKVSEDIFVCDSGLKLVYAFNSGLLEKFRVDLEYMGHPSSMTLDSRGNAFVCGKLSNVIFKVTTAKKRGKVLFTDDDGLSRPQAIACVPGEDALCVLCARDNEFKLLKIC